MWSEFIIPLHHHPIAFTSHPSIPSFRRTQSTHQSSSLLPRLSAGPHLQGKDEVFLLGQKPTMESAGSNGLVGEAFSIIRKGGICIRHNFINATEVTALQNDISQLYKSDQFKPSGLSNRIQGDKNEFGEADRLTCTITPTLLKGEAQYSYVRKVVEDKLDILKHELQNLLQEQNAFDALSMDLSEMYYSISPKGSILPRHQDERHEDTKGEKGWMHDTRRSISWLIYLNNDWNAFVDENGIEACEESQNGGAGGQFRAYCRKCSSNTQCGSHDGNLQVGWLRSQRSRHLELSENAQDDSSLESIEDYFEPIFLDSWVKMPSTLSGDMDNDSYEVDAGYGKLKWRPMSALYRIKNPINNHDESGFNRDLMMSVSNRKQLTTVVKYPNREYLSEPFGADSPKWPKEIDLEPSEFIEALASQLSDQSIRQRFYGVEDIKGPDVDIVDVEPTAGTLVLFDSVVVPHEVLEVTRGERLAVAGWFHEIQQPFPDWYGT